jgi:hypothetical protein
LRASHELLQVFLDGLKSSFGDATVTSNAESLHGSLLPPFTRTTQMTLVVEEGAWSCLAIFGEAGMCRGQAYEQDTDAGSGSDSKYVVRSKWYTKCEKYTGHAKTRSSTHVIFECHALFQRTIPHPLVLSREDDTGAVHLRFLDGELHCWLLLCSSKNIMNRCSLVAEIVGFLDLWISEMGIQSV